MSEDCYVIRDEMAAARSRMTTEEYVQFLKELGNLFEQEVNRIDAEKKRQLNLTISLN